MKSRFNRVLLTSLRHSRAPASVCRTQDVRTHILFFTRERNSSIHQPDHTRYRHLSYAPYNLSAWIFQVSTTVSFISTVFALCFQALLINIEKRSRCRVKPTAVTVKIGWGALLPVEHLSADIKKKNPRRCTSLFLDSAPLMNLKFELNESSHSDVIEWHLLFFFFLLRLSIAIKAIIA